MQDQVPGFLRVSRNSGTELNGKLGRAYSQGQERFMSHDYKWLQHGCHPTLWLASNVSLLTVFRQATSWCNLIMFKTQGQQQCPS